MLSQEEKFFNDSVVSSYSITGFNVTVLRHTDEGRLELHVEWNKTNNDLHICLQTLMTAQETIARMGLHAWMVLTALHVIVLQDGTLRTVAMVIIWVLFLLNNARKADRKGTSDEEERMELHVWMMLTALLTLKVLVATIDAQWEGMGDVGSARYESALLPPCPTIRVLYFSN